MRIGKWTVIIEAMVLVMAVTQTLMAADAWTPAELSTILWLDASDASTIKADSGSVTNWNDKSGSERDATQSEASYMPTTGTRTINGLNALDFTSDKLGITQLDMYGKAIFAVIDVDSLAVTRQLLSSSTANVQLRVATTGVLGYASGAPRYSYVPSTNAVTVASPAIVGYLLDTPSMYYSFNGYFETGGVDDGSGFTEFDQIGARYASLDMWDGLMGEIVVTDSMPSTNMRQRIEGYLAHKWGLEDDLPADHPYKSAAPTIAKNAPEPYVADDNTLHLWHMDEANPGPAAPAAGISGSFDLTSGNSATLGNNSYSRFGTAGDTSAASSSLFDGDSISVSSVTGTDGAFTFEAIISVNNNTTEQMIISMDNNESLLSKRPFVFYISSAGKLTFNDYVGNLIQIPIPITGDHVFEPNDWFHVAVAYNGNENTADNIKFYWTRMNITPNQANEIGSDNMTTDLYGVDAILCIGNEHRGTPGYNIEGKVDEVRISDIARAADEMLFHPYVPFGTVIHIY